MLRSLKSSLIKLFQKVCLRIFSKIQSSSVQCIPGLTNVGARVGWWPLRFDRRERHSSVEGCGLASSVQCISGLTNVGEGFGCLPLRFDRRGVWICLVCPVHSWTDECGGKGRLVAVEIRQTRKALVSRGVWTCLVCPVHSWTDECGGKGRLVAVEIRQTRKALVSRGVWICLVCPVHFWTDECGGKGIGWRALRFDRREKHLSVEGCGFASSVQCIPGLTNVEARGLVVGR
jgi:hypothetical protein